LHAQLVDLAQHVSCLALYAHITCNDNGSRSDAEFAKERLPPTLSPTASPTQKFARFAELKLKAAPSARAVTIGFLQAAQTAIAIGTATATCAVVFTFN